MSFYMAQVIADERAATVARENERTLAQIGRRTTRAPRLSFAQLLRRTSRRRASTSRAATARTATPRASTSATAPCPTAPGAAACGC